MGTSPQADEVLEGIKNGTWPYIDGAVSKQTIELKEKFECDGIDMNTWWFYTPVDWQCPACNRSKLELVRKNKNGMLMCHLMEHHDHVGDLLKTAFEKACVTKKEVVADEDAKKFVKRIAPALRAYDNIVICVDCNNADANAKKLVKAPAGFSFSSKEISQFIQASPNTPHRIDREKALESWLAAKDTFLLRIGLIERLAEITSANEHWFQPVDFRLHPETISKQAENLVVKYGLTSYRNQLLPPKHIKKKVPSGWRVKNHPIAPSPTEQEIDFVAKVTDANDWSRVSDAWHCPICNRHKRQIVRKNNKGEWSFILGSTRLWGEKGYVTLCGDCVYVAQELGKEAQSNLKVDIVGLTYHVALDEIRLLITPRPHSRHNINNGKAAQVIESIMARISGNR